MCHMFIQEIKNKIKYLKRENKKKVLNKKTLYQDFLQYVCI